MLAANQGEGQPRRPAGARYAALCSAGLDSAVLVAHLAQSGDVLPLYVSVGLAWETAERDYLARLLATPAFQHRVLPPMTLTFDMRDIYPSSHWAIRGTPPGFDTPDEEVYLVGRNVVLLTKAALGAAMQRIPTVAIGPLAGNPFPDATPEFFASMGRALSLGLAHAMEIVAPFATMHKEEVIRRGVALGVDLSLTLSCMNPQPVPTGNPQAPTGVSDRFLHCGRCSKCRERRDAFAAAGVVDPTRYAAAPPR